MAGSTPPTGCGAGTGGGAVPGGSCSTESTGRIIPLYASILSSTSTVAFEAVEPGPPGAVRTKAVSGARRVRSGVEMTGTTRVVFAKVRLVLGSRVANVWLPVMFSPPPGSWLLGEICRRRVSASCS